MPSACTLPAYSPSVCVDLVDEKLAFAQDFCATSTFKTTPPNPEESAMDCSRRNAEALVAELGEDVAENGGFDLALEATGAQSCLQMACWAMRTLGRIVAVRAPPHTDRHGQP